LQVKSVNSESLTVRINIQYLGLAIHLIMCVYFFAFQFIDI